MNIDKDKNIKDTNDNQLLDKQPTNEITENKIPFNHDDLLLDENLKTPNDEVLNTDNQSLDNQPTNKITANKMPFNHDDLLFDAPLDSYVEVHNDKMILSMKMMNQLILMKISKIYHHHLNTLMMSKLKFHLLTLIKIVQQNQ